MNRRITTITKYVALEIKRKWGLLSSKSILWTKLALTEKNILT